MKCGWRDGKSEEEGDEGDLKRDSIDLIKREIYRT